MKTKPLTFLLALTNPKVLYDRNEVLSKLCPIPSESGVYAWYFRDIPNNVPLDKCISKDSLTLLYVGISPNKVSKPNSKQDIKKRIKMHYQGNAEGSTLRKTLGILLSGKSQFPLRRVGSGNRKTFTHLGEQWLDNWMERNAFVCWQTHPQPEKLEEEMIKTLSLPLNIKGNDDHIFASELNRLRKEATRTARELPTFIEDKGQSRRKKS